MRQNAAMDDIVKQAIAKWPHVPSCYGWLALDARGRWLLRDDPVQAAGPFPQSRGTVLEHAGLIAFIERNYECAADGSWFFQNGPQRVFVELEITPLIWHIEPDFSLVSHCGIQAAAVRSCVLDEHGRLYLDAEPGFGLVYTQDMLRAADAVEQGLWTPQDVLCARLPGQFGYLMSPAQTHAVELKKQDSALK